MDASEEYVEAPAEHLDGKCADGSSEGTGVSKLPTIEEPEQDDSDLLFQGDLDKSHKARQPAYNEDENVEVEENLGSQTDIYSKDAASGAGSSVADEQIQMQGGQFEDGQTMMRDLHAVGPEKVRDQKVNETKIQYEDLKTQPNRIQQPEVVRSPSPAASEPGVHFGHGSPDQQAGYNLRKALSEQNLSPSYMYGQPYPFYGRELSNEMPNAPRMQTPYRWQPYQYPGYSNFNEQWQGGMPYQQQFPMYDVQTYPNQMPVQHGGGDGGNHASSQETNRKAHSQETGPFPPMPPMYQHQGMIQTYQTPMGQAQMQQMHHAQRMSPMDQAQRMPPMDQAQRMPPMDQTQRMPPMDQTQRMPPMDQAQRMPPMDQTQRMPPMDQAQRMSPMDQTQRMPPMDQAQRMSPMDQARRMPPMDQAQRMPPMDQAQRIPPMDQTQRMPPVDQTQVPYQSYWPQQQPQDTKPLKASSQSSRRPTSCHGEATTPSTTPVQGNIKRKQLVFEKPMDTRPTDCERSGASSTSTRTIIVSGENLQASKDGVSLYFENKKRSGGGDIEKLEFIKQTARITFTEEGVAERVVKKGNHKTGNKELMVRLQEESKTIAVTGFDSHMHPDTLEMYFEGKRAHGGDTEEGECFVNIREGIAYITFENIEVVHRILSRSHRLGGQELKVRLADDGEPHEEEEKEEEEAEEDEEEEKEYVQTTVEVRGWDETMTDQSLSLYFENKRRSGGGEVTSITRDAKKEVVYVTFESPEVAKSVASRSHKFAKKDLKVRLCSPRRMCKDRVMISGFPQEDIGENLKLYLESRSSLEVDQILYGDDGGETVVSFTEEIPDFDELAKKVRAKPFKYKSTTYTLTVAKVQETASITIRNIPPVDEEDIKCYFENTKRNGGGEIAEFEPNDDYAVLTFKESKVAMEVVKRDHKLAGKRIDVTLHYACLGESGGSAEPSTTKLPDPICVFDQDPYLLGHLKHSTKELEQLERNMRKVNADVKLFVAKGEITLSPTLFEDMPDYKNLCKKWEDVVRGELQKNLKLVDVQRVTIEKELWPSVEKVLGDLKSEGVKMVAAATEFAIVVSGATDKVKEKRKAVEAYFEELKREYVRKQHEKTETVPVKSVKLRLLLQEGIRKKLTLNDLRADVNCDAGQIVLTGQEADIAAAKSTVLLETNNISQETLTSSFNRRQLSLLKRPSMKAYLQKALEESTIGAQWEPGRDGVIVYYIKSEACDVMLNFLRDNIPDTCLPLKPEHRALVESNLFSTFRSKKVEDHGQRVAITLEDDQIIVTCAKSDQAGVVNALKDFLDNNSVHTETFTCDSIWLKFVFIHCQDRMRGIKEKLKQFLVEFNLTKQDAVFSLTIQATKQGLRQAKAEMDGLIKKIKMYQRQTGGPGMKKVLSTTLERIEADNRCVIEIQDDEGQENEDEVWEEVPAEPSSYSHEEEQEEEASIEEEDSAEEAEEEAAAEAVADVKSFGPRILLVKKDMGTEEADVLVNSSNRNLDLTQGQVSKVLLNCAGQTISDQCKEKYPKGIKLGDIAVTTGGSMKFVQEIYHCCLPDWAPDTGRQTLSDTVTRLLEKAHESKWRTFGIPALGTGNLKYDRKLVAEIFYECVRQFTDKHPDTTITDIMFIVYPKDTETVKAFDAQHKIYVEKTGRKVAGVATPPRKRGVCSLKKSGKDPEEEITAYREKLERNKSWRELVQSLPGRIRNSLPGKRRSQPTVTESPKPPTARVSQQKARPPSRKANNLMLNIYTDDESRVSRAMEAIQRELEDQSTTKSINDGSIKHWSATTKRCLDELKSEHDVEIIVDTSAGCVTVQGIQKDVADAILHAQAKIRAVEKERQDREYAVDLQKRVQWSYIEINKDGSESICDFDADENKQIEEAYTCNKETVQIGKFVFNFKDWVNYPVDDRSDQVVIIRRDKVETGSQSLPDHWTKSDDEVSFVEVKPDHPEFKKVKKNFEEAYAGNAPGKVLRLDRIENKMLMKQYEVKKKQMIQQNPGVTVERTLWHGTKPDFTMSIGKYGFNRSYCKQGDNAYGEGSYFTKDASYASRSTYAPVDKNGKQYMFQCKVLTGCFTQGKSGLRVPPQNPNQNGACFDSLVNDENDPEIFVIFNDTQAYPEYLISFQ